MDLAEKKEPRYGLRRYDPPLPSADEPDAKGNYKEDIFTSENEEDDNLPVLMNKSINFDTIEHHATFGEQQHTDSSFKDYDHNHYATAIQVQQFNHGQEAVNNPQTQHQDTKSALTAE